MRKSQKRTLFSNLKVHWSEERYKYITGKLKVFLKQAGFKVFSNHLNLHNVRILIGWLTVNFSLVYAVI